MNAAHIVIANAKFCVLDIASYTLSYLIIVKQRFIMVSLEKSLLCSFEGFNEEISSFIKFI